MSAEASRKCEFESEKLIMTLDLTLAAEVGAIEPVVERIMEQVRSRHCVAGKEFEVETSLREALANAIVHGCAEDPGKQVQVWVGCDETRGMMIVVRDPGPGFDPGEVPSPLQARQLYLEHGRGIYLINHLMDEVRFERGGTEIWMRKK